MKKLRAFLLIVSALILAALFVSCAKPAETATVTPEDTTAAEQDNFASGFWRGVYRDGTEPQYAVYGSAVSFDFQPEGKLSAQTSDSRLDGEWSQDGNTVTLKIDGKKNTGYILKNKFLVLFDGDTVTAYSKTAATN